MHLTVVWLKWGKWIFLGVESLPLNFKLSLCSFDWWLSQRENDWSGALCSQNLLRWRLVHFGSVDPFWASIKICSLNRTALLRCLISLLEVCLVCVCAIWSGGAIQAFLSRRIITVNRTKYVELKLRRNFDYMHFTWGVFSNTAHDACNNNVCQ